MQKLSQEEWIAVAISLILVGFFLGGSFLNMISADPQNVQSSITDDFLQQEIVMTDNNSEQLLVEVTQAGDGAEAQSGDTIVVDYRGRLAETGEEFDSSYSRGEPFQFVLGAGQVIAGWDQGLIGAQPGEARTLTIPSDLGYGPGGIPGVIPGGATLIFDVEVVEIISGTN